MNKTVDNAVRNFNLASAYAKDGAIVTAIQVAEEGLDALFDEFRRRRKIGLIPDSVADVIKKRRKR
jgi:hypothetical protein